MADKTRSINATDENAKIQIDIRNWRLWIEKLGRVTFRKPETVIGIWSHRTRRRR